MPNYGKQNQQRGYDQRNRSPLPTLDTSNIKLDNIGEELFNTIAKETAITIAKNPSRMVNKPTQLRRFYDEIVMWENKASFLLANEEDEQKSVDKFGEMLPFIKMINAKTAYAQGRKLVDKNYVTLINHCLNQVTDIKTMKHFKLFMEAFMGFYKVERPN